MIFQEEIKRLFDYRDGKLYWKNKLYVNASRIKIGEQAGTLLKKGYRRIQIDKKKYFEHRLIWLYHYGYSPKEIDHINRIKDDNRIENLREVNRSQNMMNCKKQDDCSSIYKGVYWNKRNKRWQSQIVKNNIRIYIGLFNLEKDAAKAYNQKAIELFGEYAYLNLIMG